MSVPIIVKVIPVSFPVEPIHTLPVPATPPSAPDTVPVAPTPGNTKEPLAAVPSTVLVK